MLFRHFADLFFENKGRVDETNLSSKRAKFVRVSKEFDLNKSQLVGD